MQYRRARAKGGRFFFTVVTYKRENLLCQKENALLIKEAIKNVSMQYTFKTDAFVMLPDHIHSIWTLPDGDSDFSTRWRLIKYYFSIRFNKREEKQKVWQGRYWEHQIRDERDFAAHVDYIHYNPVKHGYVKSPKDWEYSSFHRYVRNGIYDKDWGVGEQIIIDKDAGNE